MHLPFAARLPLLLLRRQGLLALVVHFEALLLSRRLNESDLPSFRIVEGQGTSIHGPRCKAQINNKEGLAPVPASSTETSSAANCCGRTPAEPVADAHFLRRILFGLIAATVLTGAMTAALTTRPPIPGQGIEVAGGL
jgi:hypothetical protein